MEFIETPTFTRQVQDLPNDEEYCDLQNTLAADPECGDLVKAGGWYPQGFHDGPRRPGEQMGERVRFLAESSQ